MAERALQPGQATRIMIGFVDGREPVVRYESGETVFEAPNWSADGRWLIVNGDGRLWRLSVDSEVDDEVQGEPELIELELPPLNNDHVLDPDGAHVFVSANDGHLYRAPLAGGDCVRVTRDPEVDRFWHFLHGVSPDGQTLASIGLQGTPGRAVSADIYLVDVTSGEQRRITGGTALADGCEFSPDGHWIYLNTEQFSAEPGHAQIARLRPDGSELTQLTFDERVNWFPHWSPDGSTALYLSFPTGTIGHPADQPVELRLVTDGDWANAQTIISLFGGQGTMNVNSWAPSNDRFGYVEYPISES